MELAINENYFYLSNSDWGMYNFTIPNDAVKLGYYLKAETKGDIVEIPLSLYDVYLNANKEKCPTLCKPLYRVNRGSNRNRSVITALNNLGYYFVYSSSLLALEKVKDVYYYGASGIVGQNPFYPYFIITVSINKRTGKIVHSTLRIHSKAFQDEENPVTKYITTKYIKEFIALNNRGIVIDTRATGQYVLNNFKVKIDDMEDILLYPTMPSIQDSDASINKFASENIDMLFNS